MSEKWGDMIEVFDQGGLRVVTLARPDKANALTSDMLKELIAACTGAQGKSKAVILTGQGKVFSAGADLGAVQNGLATSRLWEDLSAAIAGLDCLTICALNGTLAGGAFGMALACDIRIAADHAKFFYPVMKLGVLPQPSDPGRLSALIGPARTKMLLMAGQKIEAEEALGWGLVDRVVEAEALMDAARALAADVLAADRAHIAAIKGLIGRV